MMFLKSRLRARILVGAGLIASMFPNAYAADTELLNILLENGIITEEQHANLLKKESLTSSDLMPAAPEAAQVSESHLEQVVAEAVSAKIEDDFPVVASRGSSGFRLESRDGNWQTNLQWRAQLRYTNPFAGDPRQIDDLNNGETSNFEARRLRMKIGGHGFQPWIKYYFEVDLQPSRSRTSSSSSSSARVIDWRVDLAKWDWGGFRVGQWKIDMNRERVDSSGRQQFVERSIVNRVFTIDRQVGVQMRGHAFKDTAADLRYYIGAFNGEGKGVNNNNENMMYSGRLQWNFMGRDLSWRQTDVEFTEKPTGSFAIAGMTTEGPCTRWSSSGCGNLDGFSSASTAAGDQFKIDQVVQEFAFKYRGFSVQQEYHRKEITDRVVGSKNELTGAYLQAGYFFHNVIEAVPAPLELAFRVAQVEEPNEVNRSFDNERQEYTLGGNWFFAGHNNKLTLDYSYLTIDDGLSGLDDDDHRVRFQWDVSF